MKKLLKMKTKDDLNLVEEKNIKTKKVFGLKLMTSF